MNTKNKQKKLKSRWHFIYSLALSSCRHQEKCHQTNLQQYFKRLRWLPTNETSNLTSKKPQRHIMQNGTTQYSKQKRL
jgi:hypothetical protein